MNETRNYQSMTHGEWDKMFASINKEQIQEMLMDKNVIDALITEDVSSSYPSINSLIRKARELGVTDSRYYVLFTNGYVAEVLDRRLTQKQAYGKWDYEEKKFELLTNLPNDVKWILGTDPYITILSKVSERTAKSVIDVSSAETTALMLRGISKKLEDAKDQVVEKRFPASMTDEFDRKIADSTESYDERYERELQDLEMEVNKLELVSKYMEKSLESKKQNGQTITASNLDDSGMLGENYDEMLRNLREEEAILRARLAGISESNNTIRTNQRIKNNKLASEMAEAFGVNASDVMVEGTNQGINITERDKIQEELDENLAKQKDVFMARRQEKIEADKKARAERIAELDKKAKEKQQLKDREKILNEAYKFFTYFDTATTKGYNVSRLSEDDILDLYDQIEKNDPDRFLETLEKMDKGDRVVIIPTKNTSDTLKNETSEKQNPAENTEPEVSKEQNSAENTEPEVPDSIVDADIEEPKETIFMPFGLKEEEFDDFAKHLRQKLGLQISLEKFKKYLIEDSRAKVYENYAENYKHQRANGMPSFEKYMGPLYKPEKSNEFKADDKSNTNEESKAIVKYDPANATLKNDEVPSTAQAGIIETAPKKLVDRFKNKLNNIEKWVRENKKKILVGVGAVAATTALALALSPSMMNNVNDDTKDNIPEIPQEQTSDVNYYNEIDDEKANELNNNAFAEGIYESASSNIPLKASEWAKNYPIAAYTIDGKTIERADYNSDAEFYQALQGVNVQKIAYGSVNGQSLGLDEAAYQGEVSGWSR